MTEDNKRYIRIADLYDETLAARVLLSALERDELYRNVTIAEITEVASGRTVLDDFVPSLANVFTLYIAMRHRTSLLPKPPIIGLAA